MGKTLMATAGGVLLGLEMGGEYLREAAALADPAPRSFARRFESIERSCFGAAWGPRMAIAEDDLGYRLERMDPVDALVLAVQPGKAEEIACGLARNVAALVDRMEGREDACVPIPAGGRRLTRLPVVLPGMEALRDFRARLGDRGIETEPGYVPLHLEAFGGHFRREPLERCEAIWRRITHLPIRPNLLEEEVHRIGEALAERRGGTR
jgi:dTDP-4-amino-4,6-dideoxygalactose transaminase